MSYHHQEERKSKTITMARKGIDVFHKEPNTIESISCRACGAVCNVERNSFGPTSHLSAMSGNHTLHDRFICPNIGKKWHELASNLVQEINNTQSKSIIKLIAKDLRKALSKKPKSKATSRN